MNDLLLAGLALFVFFVWVLVWAIARGRKSGGKKRNVDPKRRRTEAMKNLEKIRKRVQNKHGPLIDLDNLPPEVMQKRIEDDANSDSRKAAATLKKMLED